jgi:hypothetical protein
MVQRNYTTDQMEIAFPQNSGEKGIGGHNTDCGRIEG